MRYRHAWPGFLLLGALAVLLVSLLAWSDQFLSPGPAGGIRRLLQLRLASGVTEEAPEAPLGEAAASGVERRDPFRAADHADPPRPSENPPATPPAGTAPARPISLPTAQARYALDLGTFAIEEDAERAETQLNQAGFSTVRFRQQAPARLFTVSIRPLDPVRQGGFPAPTSPRERGGESVRVAQALPLRSAVSLAEHLRSSGYATQIKAETPGVGRLTLRHGNFASRPEAEAVSLQIERLGVPAEVVQVK